MNYKISDKVRELYRILCETDRIYNSLLSKMQITDSEFALLFSLMCMGEGCLQKDIADNSYISKKTLNSTVKKLEKEGILKLKPGKYPNMHLYLTQKGKDFVEDKLIPIMQAEDDVLQTVSDDDFGSFSMIVTKYFKLFEENYKANS